MTKTIGRTDFRPILDRFCVQIQHHQPSSNISSLLLAFCPMLIDSQLTTVRRWLNWPWPLRWIMFTTYVVTVTWLSLAPADTFRNLPLLFPHADKVLHFLLYGVMVAVGRWTLSSYWVFRPNLPWLAAIAYGILMEVMQALLVSHHRSFELGDIAANSFGALCFWWLSRWILHPVPELVPEVRKHVGTSGVMSIRS